jgi:type IV pilus assembly protein PilE
MKYQHGFTLMELMITVVIVGILSSIAIPQYQSYLLKSYRSEGMTELLDIMRSQENYFSNSYTYTIDFTHLGRATTPYITTSGKYSISAATCSGSLDLTQCVFLTASPLGSQISDGPLTLDSQGNKTRNGVNRWK